MGVSKNEGSYWKPQIEGLLSEDTQEKDAQ